MGTKVSVVMGSDSDFEVMEEAVKTLNNFGVENEVLISSAHRSPERTREFGGTVEERGVNVIIVGAGAAAHLAGVIAAETLVPVIGVPIDSSPLKGVDALYSTVQMPGGIPVATMAIGKAGAKNAAILAVEILSLNDQGLKNKLVEYRKELAEGVEKKNLKIQNR